MKYCFGLVVKYIGTFKSSESTNLFSENGIALRQDYVERVGFDDKYLTEDSIISVEHLSVDLSLKKY